MTSIKEKCKYYIKQKIRQPIINYKRKGFKLQDESEVKVV